MAAPTAGAPLGSGNAPFFLVATIFLCLLFVANGALPFSRIRKTPSALSSHRASEDVARLFRERAAGLDSLAQTDPELTKRVLEAVDSILSWGTAGKDDWREIKHGSVIMAFSFGSGTHGDDIGQQNRALAQSVAKTVQAFRARGECPPPIMAQWEVADALLLGHGIAVDFRAAIPEGGSYISTYDVVLQYQQWASVAGLPVWTSDSVGAAGTYSGTKTRRPAQALLVAHPDHRWRCSRLLAAGGGPAAVWIDGRLAPDWPTFGCDSDGYTPASSQPWTRTRRDFVLHELWVRPKELEAGHM